MQMNWKKVMAGTLSVCMLATCVPGVSGFGGYEQAIKVVQAATTKKAVSGKCGKKATWKYNTKTKTLTIAGSGAVQDYENYTDDKNGEVDTTPWSGYKEQIKKVVVGDNITVIGEDAFSECSALQVVKLGKNVKKIKGYAFSLSPKLKKINLGDKLQGISTCAFRSCNALEEVYLGKAVKNISNYAFQGCNGLKTIKVHSKNKYFTMQGNSLLNKKKTKWILGSFTSDTTCHIDSGITELNYEALKENTNIENFEVSSENEMYSSDDGLLYSKDQTSLYMCPRGKKGTVTINDKTTQMSILDSLSGEGVFEGCSSLEGIIIGKNMKSIDGIFSGCEKLTKVEISEENEYYTSVNGIILSKDKKELCYCAVTNQGTIVVPEGVTVIRDGAFFECGQDVENLILPDNMTDYQTNLDSFKSITFGKNYYNNGDVSWVRDATEEIHVQEENPYYAALDGVLYNKNKTKLLICPSGMKICHMPNTVTNVASTAFPDIYNKRKALSLEELYVSDSIIDMGQWDLGDKLKTLHIGKKVENVGELYSECLENITVSSENQTYKAEDNMLYTKDGSELVVCPGGIKGRVTVSSGTSSIGAYAFSYSENVTEVVIPASVTVIGVNAFYSMNKNVVFYVPAGSKDYYQSLFSETGTGFKKSMTIKEMK